MAEISAVVPKFRVEEGTIECRAKAFRVNPSRGAVSAYVGPQQAEALMCSVATKKPGILHVDASLDLLLALDISVSTCMSRLTDLLYRPIAKCENILPLSILLAN